MSFFKPKYRQNRVMDIPYESGLGYWPETVSESVSDRDSAAGKIFFTFCLIAGISFFMSWYPFNLRNVYTGPAAVLSDCGGNPLLYWTTFRQYVPHVGLFMLIGVSVYPSQIAMETNGGLICLAIHLTGASMMFMGYMLAEFKCLGVFGMKVDENIRSNFLNIEGDVHNKGGLEKCLRIVYVMTMFGFYTLFLVFEVALIMWAPCCADVWAKEGTWYNRTNPENGALEWNILAKATVTNTASGTYFWLKVAAYFSECFAGIFLILSHLTVWWYCEERHVPYGDSRIEMVYNEHIDDGTEDEEEFDEE
jgi:hypothetical protein